MSDLTMADNTYVMSIKHLDKVMIEGGLVFCA